MKPVMSRYNLYVVCFYELKKKWKFGTVFVYRTANSILLAELFQFINIVFTQEYSGINQFHCVDLSASPNIKTQKNKKPKSYRVFSIDNMYNLLILISLIIIKGIALIVVIWNLKREKFH